jgi:glycosyltransferase involved in cell wall biosynthesis
MLVRNDVGSRDIGMRVLHVIAELTGGGAERLVAQLVPKIQETGMKCAVMSVYPSGVPHELIEHDVDVIQISRKGRFDAGFFPRMVGAMKSWKPDVVHTHLHSGNYWGRAAAIAAGVPTIVRTEHAPCDPSTRVPGSGIADRVLNNASGAVITFLEEQGRFLARFEGLDFNKIAIIPNGIVHAPLPTAASIAEGRARLGVEQGVFAIVQLGNLLKVKNQRLALQTIAAIDPALRHRARLFFVGDGADRLSLTERVRELHLEEYVKFLGFRNDAAQLLPGASLTIMPSIQEGMPLALLEAMSAGVPVLTTPWIGARDLLHGGLYGIVTEDWNPATLARGVESVMTQYEAARAVAQRAQTIVRREYDIALTAQRHCDLYQRLRARKAAA